MTQEEKSLLLKDLCGRLPYGVKMIDTEPHNDSYNPVLVLSHISKDGAIGCHVDKGFMVTSLGTIKPYLFPLSSMTREQEREFRSTLTLLPHVVFIWSDETFDWCNKNHFDYRGLIPLGLANNATGLNIY